MAIKYYYDLEQGTDAWLDARLGIVTASQISKLLTPTGKIATGAKVKAFAYEIVAQRETWRVENYFQSYDMERGHIQEGIARNIYSESFEEVNECGFITNTNYGFKIGASPDGLVGDNGGIEIKSRLSKFHVMTVAEEFIDPAYMQQIQMTLLVSGREWWDFVSYSNGLPLFVKRVFPDKEMFNKIVEAMTGFEAICSDIKEKYEKNMKSLVKTKYVELMMDDEISGSNG